MPLDFVMSQKVGDNIVLDGHRFYLNGTSTAGKKLWKCVQHRKNRCIAVCHTMGEEVVLHRDSHNHAPNVMDIKSKDFLADLKDSATLSAAPTHQIVSNMLARSP